MAHAFDGHSLRQVLADSESLVADAITLEHRLAWLVRVMEVTGDTSRAPSGKAATASTPNLTAPGTPAEVSLSPDLLTAVREVCVAARDQRQRAQAILTHLVGDLRDDTRAKRHPSSILVVDDSGDHRDLVAATLEESGFHTITANNGLEAVIVAHYAHPAVVLMDVTMPVLDGIEAARLLKASAATRDLKVIAHTAKPDFYYGPMARLFVDVLPKPASPDAIVASVQRYVESPPSP